MIFSKQQENIRTSDPYPAYVAPAYVKPGEALQPLIRRLRAYDQHRHKLWTEGGRLIDFASISDLLKEPVCIHGNRGKHEVSLTDHAAMRTMLYDVGAGKVHHQVRQVAGQWPVYYLCRTRNDYWSEYSLIVEDLYRSPDYPMADERFASLMHFGHETRFLRMSLFRQKMLEQDTGKKGANETYADCVIYNLGRYIFQAAWHEDQRPAVLCARSFDMPKFREAVELLYLCLSGEICALRSAISESMIHFVTEIYPHEAILRFLQRLPELEGHMLNDIPQLALKFYARLSASFTQFLTTEVRWGWSNTKMPLYKAVFGNIKRMEMVAAACNSDNAVRNAATVLEGESESIINAIITLGNDVDAVCASGMHSFLLADDRPKQSKLRQMLRWGKKHR